MSSDKRRSNFSLFLSELVCGGGAAAISKTVVAPLERVKVLLQAQHVMVIPEKYKFKGFVDALTRIPREQGVLAFWRGNGANLYRIVPAVAIRFTSYDAYKRKFMPRGEFGYSGAERVLLKMNTAFFAGLTSLLVTYPFDVLKTRLSLDFAKVGEPRVYKGFMDAFKKTRKGEGFRALYRGFLLSVGINLPYAVISVGTYDILRDMFIVGKSGDQINALVKYIGLGTIAGVFAQVATYPFDTVRKRIQVNGALGQEALYKSTLDCFKKTFQTEGIKGFYGGMVPNLVKIAPAAAVQFAAYDLLKKNVADARLI